MLGWFSVAFPTMTEIFKALQVVVLGSCGHMAGQILVNSAQSLQTYNRRWIVAE